MVHINNLKPVLKKGWIAKDKNGKWFWYSQQPYISTMFEDCWTAPVNGFAVALHFAIDIEDDGVSWRKSCQKVGGQVGGVVEYSNLKAFRIDDGGIDWRASCQKVGKI